MRIKSYKNEIKMQILLKIVKKYSTIYKTKVVKTNFKRFYEEKARFFTKIKCSLLKCRRETGSCWIFKKMTLSLVKLRLLRPIYDFIFVKDFFCTTLFKKKLILFSHNVTNVFLKFFTFYHNLRLIVKF